MHTVTFFGALSWTNGTGPALSQKTSDIARVVITCKEKIRTGCSQDGIIAGLGRTCPISQRPWSILEKKTSTLGNRMDLGPGNPQQG